MKPDADKSENCGRAFDTAPEAVLRCLPIRSDVSPAFRELTTNQPWSHHSQAFERDGQLAVFYRKGVVRCCWSVLIVLAFSSPLIGQETQPSASAHAIADVFDDCHIHDTAWSVSRRVATLPGNERFGYLLNWVLPHGGRSTLRLSHEFLPSYPISGPKPEGTAWRRQATGGDIVCPAFDLIRLTKTSEERKLLLETLQRFQPRNRIDSKNRLVLLCLLTAAQEAPQKTLEICDEIKSLIRPADPFDEHHRTAELLMLVAAAEDPNLREIVSEFAPGLFRAERWDTYGELWSRQFARYAFEILPVVAEDVVDRRTSGSDLRFWSPVAYPSAFRRGMGFPVSRWSFPRSHAINYANHGDDAVYFRIPILGEFTVETDVTVTNWREAEVLVDATWVAPSASVNSYDTGGLHGAKKTVEFDSPTTRQGYWYRHRTAIKDGFATTSLDGHIGPVRQLPPKPDPWIAIRSRQLNEGGARNFRLSGSPEIPSVVNLLDRRLASWTNFYGRATSAPESPWAMSGNELIGKLQPELDGSVSEQAIHYHRPIVEDGVITYEFFLDDLSAIALPAIDQLVFTIKDGKAGMHRLTNGPYERTTLTPDNFSPTTSLASKLPLRQNAWNKVKLDVTENDAAVSLNGQRIVEYALHPENPRFFGLYFDSSHHSLRVRNLEWRGEWPKRIPAASENSLAGSETEFLEKDTDRLAEHFHHDFAVDGLPPKLFRPFAGTVDRDIFVTDKGIRTVAAEYARVVGFEFRPVLKGDFDVIARYRDFGGPDAGGARLAAELNNPRMDQVTGGRKQFLHENGLIENVGFLWYRYEQNGRTLYHYDKGQNIEETAGAVRLSRRGKTIHVLTAEDGSDNFRWHMSEEVGDENSVPGGIQLQSEIPGLSVTWTSIEIHAEHIETN